MVQSYNAGDLPMWNVKILASVLEEYGVRCDLIQGRLDIVGGEGNIARGLPVAEAKAGLLQPMATRWLRTTL